MRLRDSPQFITLMLFLSSILITAESNAGIYKCENEYGDLSFSDQPCEGGSSKKLPGYEEPMSLSVNGTVVRERKSISFKDGFAYWQKKPTELMIVLTPRSLTATEKQQAIIGDVSFATQEKIPGMGRLTLFMNEGALKLRQLKHFKGEFYGLDKSDPAAIWTSHIGGDDIQGHVTYINLKTEKGKAPWLTMTTQELSQYIRWSINITVPLYSSFTLPTLPPSTPQGSSK